VSETGVGARPPQKLACRPGVWDWEMVLWAGRPQPTLRFSFPGGRDIANFQFCQKLREPPGSPRIHSAMKRLLLLAAALSLTLAAGAAPIKRADYVVRLQTCEAILQDTMTYPNRAIPADIFHRAKGIVILNQVHVGFLFGVRGGWGIAMVKHPNGQWSVPIFLSGGELSFGLQAGGKSVETVFLLMDETTTRMLFKSRFNLGLDAKAVAGPVAAEAETTTRNYDAQVLVYTNVKGFYAGATVKTGSVTPLTEATQQFYNTDYGLPEILFSDWVAPAPEAREIMAYMQRVSP
jgi:SH3 domain-containing YSC84-like protein 1